LKPGNHFGEKKLRNSKKKGSSGVVDSQGGEKGCRSVYPENS